MHNPIEFAKMFGYMTSVKSAPPSTKERKKRAKEPKSNATLKRRKANKARKTHRK